MTPGSTVVVRVVKRRGNKSRRSRHDPFPRHCHLQKAAVVIVVNAWAGVVLMRGVIDKAGGAVSSDVAIVGRTLGDVRKKKTYFLGVLTSTVGTMSHTIVSGKVCRR